MIIRPQYTEKGQKKKGKKKREREIKLINVPLGNVLKEFISGEILDDNLHQLAPTPVDCAVAHLLHVPAEFQP